MRGRWWVAGLVAAGLVTGSTAAAQASELVTIPIPARNGEVADMWLPRYPHGGPPLARVLLPDGYDPAKAYPLLVLLVGLSSNYSDWSGPGQGEIATTAKGFPGIIVMPEGGDGWYADWWNHGRRGSPAWESYTLDQVIPQVLARYRIRPERRYHALAGVSMGGLGTAYLGGRLPGFFGSVAVISGLVDLELSSGEGAAQSAISQTNAGVAPTDPEAVEGPPGGFYVSGHNPVKLGANMAQTRVFMASGDGTPAADSGHGTNSPTDQAEEGTIIHPASNNYAAALRAAGVDLVYQEHAGYHDWPNFRRELRDAITWGLFKRVDEHARDWVNDTVATHGKLWEFAYRFDAPPDRVVRFRRKGDVLAISQAGSPVTITTDGGCVIHVATPADVEVPHAPCARPALGCLARRASVLSRGIGRVRVGSTRRALERRLGVPRSRGRRAERWCVAGGGTVRVVYSPGGRALLVATTAAGHHSRQVRPGVSLRVLRRAFPFSRAALRGVRRAGRRSRVVIGVRGRRVAYLAVADRRLLWRPRTLRTYLRLGGLR